MRQNHTSIPGGTAVNLRMKNYNITTSGVGESKMTPKRRLTYRKLEPVVTHRQIGKLNGTINIKALNKNTIQTKKDMYSPIHVIQSNIMSNSPIYSRPITHIFL